MIKGNYLVKYEKKDNPNIWKIEVIKVYEVASRDLSFGKDSSDTLKNTYRKGSTLN